MTERNKRSGLLCRKDAGHLSRHERIAFCTCERTECNCRIGLESDVRFGTCLAGGLLFATDVDHRNRTIGRDM